MNRKEGVYNPLTLGSMLAASLADAGYAKDAALTLQGVYRAAQPARFPVPKPQPTVSHFEYQRTKNALEVQQRLGNRLLANNDNLQGQVGRLQGLVEDGLKTVGRQADIIRRLQYRLAGTAERAVHELKAENTKLKAEVAELTRRNDNQFKVISAYQNRFPLGLQTPKVVTQPRFVYGEPPRREQSEDRIPKTGLYIVVAQEDKQHGLVWYVQHPNGKRNSLRTTSAARATTWAKHQEEVAEPYSDPVFWQEHDKVVA